MLEYKEYERNRWRAHHGPVTIWLYDDPFGDFSIFVTFGSVSQQMYADSIEKAKKLAHEWIREKTVELLKELGYGYSAFVAQM